MAKRFLKSISRLYPPVRDLARTWNLILSKLMNASFKPMATCSLPYFLMKVGLPLGNLLCQGTAGPDGRATLYCCSERQSIHESTSQMSAQVDVEFHINEDTHWCSFPNISLTEQSKNSIIWMYAEPYCSIWTGQNPPGN